MLLILVKLLKNIPTTSHIPALSLWVGLQQGDRYSLASLGRERLKNITKTVEISCVLGPFQE